MGYAGERGRTSPSGLAAAGVSLRDKLAAAEGHLGKHDPFLFPPDLLSSQLNSQQSPAFPAPLKIFSFPVCVPCWALL